MKSIFDRSFVYTNSAETDVGKTFRRIRRKQREEEEACKAAEEEAKTKVAQIGPKKAVAR